MTRVNRKTLTGAVWLVAAISATNSAGTPGGGQDTEIGNLIHTAETNNGQVFNDVSEALEFTATGGKKLFNGHF